MKKDTVILLCNMTSFMGDPWRKRGYRVIDIDPQLPNNGTIIEMIALLSGVIRSDRVAFVGGFPPCTDLAVSGAAHFANKAKIDKHFQAKAALIAEQCRMIGSISDCPWFFENPVSVLSSIMGKPNEVFHPYEYAGYLDEDDVHPLYPEYIPPRDLYPKKTCLWTGGGFVMPEKKIIEVPKGYSDMHKKLGGKSLKTKNIRSATPRGFAEAVYLFNNQDVIND